MRICGPMHACACALPTSARGAPLARLHGRCRGLPHAQRTRVRYTRSEGSCHGHRSRSHAPSPPRAHRRVPARPRDAAARPTLSARPETAKSASRASGICTMRDSSARSRDINQLSRQLMEITTRINRQPSTAGARACANCLSPGWDEKRESQAERRPNDRTTARITLARAATRALRSISAAIDAEAAGGKRHPPVVNTLPPAASDHQPLKSGSAVIKVPIGGNQSPCSEELDRSIE